MIPVPLERGLKLGPVNISLIFMLMSIVPPESDSGLRRDDELAL